MNPSRPIAMNRKQKILTVIAVIVFVVIGIGITYALDMLSIFPGMKSNVQIGFLSWFMVAVVYTALFLVFKDPKK